MKENHERYYWKTFFPGEEFDLEKAIEGSNLIVDTDLLSESEGGCLQEIVDRQERIHILFTASRKDGSNARVAVSVDELGCVYSISGREAEGYLPEDEFLPLIEEKLKEFEKNTIEPPVLDGLEACRKMSEIYRKQKAGDTRLSRKQVEDLYELYEELDIGGSDVDIEYDRRVYSARSFFAEQAKKDGYLTDAQEDLLNFVYGRHFNCQPDFARIGENPIRFSEPGCNINLALRHIKRELDAGEMSFLLKKENVNQFLLISVSSVEAITQNFEEIAALEDSEIIDYVVEHLPESYIEENLERLFRLGTPGVIANKMAKRVSKTFLEENVKKFLRLGVEPIILLRNMEKDAVARNFAVFLRHDVEIESLVNFLGPKTIAKNLDKLLKAGISVERAVILMSSKDIVLNLSLLRERGLDDVTLVDALSYDFVYRHFGALYKNMGISINLLLKKLDAKTVSFNLKYLLQNGATIEALGKKLPIDLKTKRHLVAMYSTEPKEEVQKWLDIIEAEDRDERIRDFIEQEKYLEFLEYDDEIGGE